MTRKKKIKEPCLYCHKTTGKVFCDTYNINGTPSYYHVKCFQKHGLEVAKEKAETLQLGSLLIIRLNAVTITEDRACCSSCGAELAIKTPEQTLLKWKRKS